jgi:lysyl-tRNA synthetase class 2
LTPSLPPLPYKLEDRETRIRNRHVDLLVNKTAADTLRIRSHIIQYIRNFLLADDFLEVQTPILADKAGGAIARPFTTIATEFPDKQLALRIAPEIWLKRLVLGGMNRVFEIGSAFRNEGLDATHNPEFTTCEFYKSFASLEDLISMTEELISGLAEQVKSLREFPLKSLPELDGNLFSTPFKRIQFVPAVEAALGESLPDLVADNATENLLALFTRHNLPVPLTLTLPRLLDKLASILIEPQCNEPTFIMHHPACMAPLSKSFLDPQTDQMLSARVELFIHQKEIANMYEEENSPFEQRMKFLQQAQWKDDGNTAGVDESYLEALEWGLPPTGGWGCGVDRLVMLFSGASRISDVLSFGSLRNVVNLGRKAASDKDEKHKVVKRGQSAPV